ncbi:probable phospholipid-transporting ATPase IA [Panulirus ornatus]|uniref:probable phospholipid-transporting ATPase IA n=1 Tax=Panulirus ornatus TaxID=150431 RepID=UPI003A84D88B
MLGVGNCGDVGEEERVAMWARGGVPPGCGQYWPGMTWGDLQAWPREEDDPTQPHVMVRAGRDDPYPSTRGIHQPGDHTLTPATHHLQQSALHSGDAWLLQEAHHAHAGDDSTESSQLLHMGLVDLEENVYGEAGSGYGPGVVYDPPGTHAGSSPPHTTTSYPTYENVYVQVGDYLVLRSEAAHHDHQHVGAHRASPDASDTFDAYDFQDDPRLSQEGSLWLHQEATPLCAPPGSAEEVLILGEGDAKEGECVRAAVDASLAGLDNPALEHTLETQAHVDRLARALGDRVRCQIDDTLSRIDDTRAEFNLQRRRPFSDGVPPATAPGGSGRRVVTAAGGSHGHPPGSATEPRTPRRALWTESVGVRRMSPVVPEEPLWRGRGGSQPAAASPEAGAAAGDRGSASPPPHDDEAPLARQETMVESVREYDDISVTTLLTLDTSTPTPTPARSNKSLRSLKSEPSVKSLKSRGSWVSVAWRGSSLSSTVTSLEPLHLDQLFRRSDDDSGGGGSEGDGGGGVGGGMGGLGGGAGGQEHRIVYLNEPQPYKYCSNAICTAKYRYKLLFFLPMFLFEQFRRYANVFFLIIALLQQIPGVSPTGRYTTLVPLICILVVSAIKEIAEDIKRHRADDEINKREIEVLKDGQWQWIKWRHIQVGDIVKVHNNKFFPADLILLASSEPQALCYVETANLDGETNLKIRQGLPQTAHLLEARDLMNLSGKVECEAPNRFLYQFTGNLKETSRPAIPLCPDQVLLRGAKLQNTNWVFGMVMYTGHETKLMKNSATSAPLKRSTVDKQTNNLIILLFFLLIVLCLIMAVCNSQWNANLHWYLSLDDLSVFNFGINFITFIILFNNLIPISLQVTLEVVRFIQAGFINNDINMWYEENDVWAMARTSNLNEELGMIKYVLSDKTGTLTRNVMEFKRCTIGGSIYSMDDGSGQELIMMMESGGAGAAVARQFLTMLAVCHTVIPDRDESRGDGSIIYHAASPDERALVEGARELGFVFETRTPEYAIVDVLGTKEKFEVLNVLEFTSARKRMSVIVKTPQGQIKLYCKGADTVICERLGDNQQFRDLTVRHLEEFAGEGLRTLCYAVADISPEFYEEWKNTFYKASTALQFRERKLEDAAQLIENNLTLLGATAIEDKLQDEVPETIAALLKAGIHVWVLTGDKQETAINIGHSCHLLNQGMPLIILNTESLDETRDAINRHVVEFGEQLKRENEAALIIDGKTLIYALTPDLRKDFLDLCISCKSVICCRVSPSQKAEVVELLTRETGSVTLAIGDGANDVAMIQKANVGVGIAGLEGLQAACASDYAIGQFRFLARLLFVHGAWNYSRLCKVILYSFYKNICLYVIELWWAAMSGWSGQVLFERWSIAMYNVLFTAAPPLVMGIFDRSCSAETRMKYPELYRESQSGSYFNWKVYIYTCVCGWVGPFFRLFPCATSLTRETATKQIKKYKYNISLFFFQVYSSPVFWFGLIFIPLACLLPDVCVKTLRNSIRKSLTEQVRESEISNKDVSKVLDTKHRLTETARLLKNVFRRTTTRVNLEVELAHGYAFSQEEHGVIGQSEVIRAYDTTQPKPGGIDWSYVDDYKAFICSEMTLQKCFKSKKDVYIVCNSLIRLYLILCCNN